MSHSVRDWIYLVDISNVTEDAEGLQHETSRCVQLIIIRRVKSIKAL